MVVRHLAKFNTGRRRTRLLLVPVRHGPHVVAVYAALSGEVIAQRLNKFAFAGKPDEVIFRRYRQLIQPGGQLAELRQLHLAAAEPVQINPRRIG